VEATKGLECVIEYHHAHSSAALDMRTPHLIVRLPLIQRLDPPLKRHLNIHGRCLGENNELRKQNTFYTGKIINSSTAKRVSRAADMESWHAIGTSMLYNSLLVTAVHCT
jgi:hypothetical protein